MTRRLVLVSHLLCPYVQRAAIVLAEKGIPFERIDVDLAHKPGWFLDVSPLGKTPVLLVDGAPVFESAVICEFLEDTAAPHLHPTEPLARARHRSWIEFASAMLNTIGAFYSAPDEAALEARAQTLQAQAQQLEAALATAPQDGPYFGGQPFAVVDAAFAPVFRYFDVFDTVSDFARLDSAPRVRAWRAALQRRPSVQSAVSDDYAKQLHAFLLHRESALARRMRRDWQSSAA